MKLDRNYLQKLCVMIFVFHSNIAFATVVDQFNCLLQLRASLTTKAPSFTSRFPLVVSRTKVDQVVSGVETSEGFSEVAIEIPGDEKTLKVLARLQYRHAFQIDGHGKFLRGSLYRCITMGFVEEDYAFESSCAEPTANPFAYGPKSTWAQAGELYPRIPSFPIKLFRHFLSTPYGDMDFVCHYEKTMP